MKLKLGHRLLQIREDRRLSQTEMSDLLSMSSSAYSRLERGETSLPFEDLPGVAQALGIGVQDLLPDTLTINNTNNTNQAGLIFGNIYNYYQSSELVHELQAKIEFLVDEVRKLKDQAK
jgi:transcriptional regulator with XRE-family HTH domain